MTTQTPTNHPIRALTTGLLLAGFVIVGLAAAVLFVTRPFTPSVAWQLDGFGGPVLDPATARTTTDFQVYVPSWPGQQPAGQSWLAQPTVIDTPIAVIVTLHTSAAYQAMIRQGPVGTYDTGGWVTIHLNEPLGGRTLLDGSAFPPASRPYP